GHRVVRRDLEAEMVRQRGEGVQPLPRRGPAYARLDAVDIGFGDVAVLPSAQERSARQRAQVDQVLESLPVDRDGYAPAARPREIGTDLEGADLLGNQVG